nr:MAG TPA: hypothetical protein [Caudoviricetes sp.]
MVVFPRRFGSQTGSRTDYHLQFVGGAFIRYRKGYGMGAAGVPGELCQVDAGLYIQGVRITGKSWFGL